MIPRAAPDPSERRHDMTTTTLRRDSAAAPRDPLRLIHNLWRRAAGWFRKRPTPAPAPEPAPRVDLIGRWRIEGFAPNGARYAGAVDIRPAGHVYAVHWRIESGAMKGQSYQGLGVASAKALAIAFNGGAALFEVTGDDRMAGAWSTVKGRTLGAEVWTRAPMLSS